MKKLLFVILSLFSTLALATPPDSQQASANAQVKVSGSTGLGTWQIQQVGPTGSPVPTPGGAINQGSAGIAPWPVIATNALALNRTVLTVTSLTVQSLNVSFTAGNSVGPFSVKMGSLGAAAGFYHEIGSTQTARTVAGLFTDYYAVSTTPIVFDHLAPGSMIDFLGAGGTSTIGLTIYKEQ